MSMQPSCCFHDSLHGAHACVCNFLWHLTSGLGRKFKPHGFRCCTIQVSLLLIHALSSHMSLTMCAGGSKGRIQIFDLQEGQEVASYQAAADTVNGLQFHPFLPLAATASGKHA